MWWVLINPLRAALAGIPELAFLADATFTPVASDSHQTYKVCHPDLTAALKWLDHRYPRFIDLKREYTNHCIAAAIGVAPKVVYYDPRIWVSHWMKGALPLQPVDVKDWQLFEKLADILARIHTSESNFSNDVSLLQIVDWNLKQCPDQRQREHELRQQAARLLHEDQSDRVNCHGDTTLGNFMVYTNTDALELIDFEYSHRGSAFWDLAILCNDLHLQPDEAGAFLGRYLRYRDESSMVNPSQLSLLNQYRRLVGDISELWYLNRNLAQPQKT